MKKTIRSWICINQTTIGVEALRKVILATPKEEILFGDVKCEDGDKTVTVDDLLFASTYRDGGEFTPVTKAKFNKLSESEQIDYINELGNFYSDCDLVEKADVSVIDLDSDTEIENLFDYLLDLNNEGTDLKDRCFADNTIDLIDEIITDNISNIDEYDTVQDFLESIKQALCDGEYLATLDTDEATVEQAYSMLDNNEYELDKGIILNHFLDKSGLKVNFLIGKLGINKTTYYRKIYNDFNFSRAELMRIKEVLHLTNEEFLKLF